MDVSENGQIFVTVGVRHVKFWKALASATPGVSTLQVHSIHNTLIYENVSRVDRQFSPNSEIIPLSM